ncbi:MAG: hypothetical protein ABSH53_06360 [Holophaga sp.]|jgi:hypothetical protein
MASNRALAALVGGSIFVALLVCLAILILPTVFYLLSMQKALTLAGRENRRMEPGMVWLMFIPLFGMVWQFFIVRRVSEAVMNWAQGHGRNVADGGWTIGLTACILCCCGIIPVIGIFAAVAGLVCAIIWWAKVASFNALMSPKTA